MSDDDLQKLDYCAEVLRLSKADVIRTGIRKMFSQAQRKERNMIMNTTQTKLGLLAQKLEEGTPFRLDGLHAGGATMGIRFNNYTAVVDTTTVLGETSHLVIHVIEGKHDVSNWEMYSQAKENNTYVVVNLQKEYVDIDDVRHEIGDDDATYGEFFQIKSKYYTEPADPDGEDGDDAADKDGPFESRWISFYFDRTDEQPDNE